MSNSTEMTKEEIMEEIKKEREVEQNKRDAIQMANNLFKIISSSEVVRNTTPEQRHKICIEKSKNFSDAFPLVMAKMARENRYSEIAFRKFLDKLHQDPGQGMEGVMERQSDYVKFLYIEECKKSGRHWSMKTANNIWQQEYNHMKKWVKKTKNQEKKIKSEFEDEQVKHVDERKQELFDWLQEAREQQKEEDPEAFSANQIDLNNLDADDMSISDSDELPQSLVDTTQKQNRDVVVSQEPIVPQTEEEEKAAENYRKAYEERIETERLESERLKEVHRETLHRDMLTDSLITQWKAGSKKTSSRSKKNKKRR